MQCPMCQSENLTELGDYSPGETNIKYKDKGTGLWSADLTVKPQQARICKACGYVMLFLDSKGLDKVKQALQ